nr:methyl-accepting chemotaxis protein [Pseudomonas sp. BJa5]MDL2428407.1 methyl-accepting chemotaxis protein [Pseudomonas sp. BJa5]
MRLPIKLRIVIIVGICLVALTTVLIGYSIHRASHATDAIGKQTFEILKSSAVERMKSQGQIQTLEIQRYFLRNFLYGSGLARQFSSQIHQAQKTGQDPSQIRSDLHRQIGEALKDKPDLLALYVVYEPNSMTGIDAPFANRRDLGSTDSGRFSSYWLQRDNELSQLAVTEEMIANTSPMLDGTPFNAWYTCPKSSMKPCILNPYFETLGKNRNLITSLTFPMVEDGKVIAVVGMDISLSNFQGLAVHGSQSLFDGSSQISLVSSAGLIAAHSPDDQMLSQSVSSALPLQARQIQDALSAGQDSTMSYEGFLHIAKPFSPIPDARPWVVLLDVPEEVLFKPAHDLMNTFTVENSETNWMSLLIGLAAACVGLIVVWLTARAVTRPITRVSTTLRDIASGEGDLTQRLQHNTDDELGELVQWFNRFLDKLQPIVADVKQSVSAAQDTANRTARVAVQTSEGMQQQFRELEQVATASHEMSATAQDVAKSASRAADATLTAEQATNDGLSEVDRTSRSIEALANEMSNAMHLVRNLSLNSEQIGSVMAVIRAVAEQTNLLALNAAIEAARAGDAGRGFAVVADEVRSLAQRTQQSVEEIRHVVEGLQQGTDEVVRSMNTSHEQAQQSASQVKETVAALQRIGSAVTVINDMNLQIASAAEEQSSVAEEINRNISSIRDVTESLAAQAEDAAQISQHLNTLASQQHSLMAHFKT